MNISSLISRLKINLGLYVIALPFENSDEFIENIVKDITLKTYSIYQPYYQKFNFNTHDLELVEKHANYATYLLPDIFSNRDILFVKNVEYDDTMLSGIGMLGGLPLISNNSMQDLIIGNAGAKMTSMMIPRLTFKYEHPRKVTIYNGITSCKLTFDIALTHDKSLASIAPENEETFYQLALLDVKWALYSTLKHYDDIQTAYGNINLKLEDWSNAENDRKDLLNDWNNVHHLDQEAFYWL